MTTVQVVKISNIRTSLSPLRSPSIVRLVSLSSLPIRVVNCEGEPGNYEVVDGFKRLRFAKDQGMEEIDVVVEQAQGAEAKALLVRSNASQNTLTPLDEARVIRSLLEEDRLSLSACARVLRRKKSWASKRYALVKRLCPSLHNAVDERRLPVSLAYALTVLRKEEQVKIGQVILQSGLSHTNGQALLSTYRALSEEEQRKALLKDPLGTLEEIARENGKSCLGISSLARRRQACHQEIIRLLEEFMDPLEGISQAESRLLEAERKRVVARIVSCAKSIGKKKSEDQAQGENE